METVLLINKHVENVLEDKPTRQEVLAYLDHIKSLETLNYRITFFIATDEELNKLRELWRFIHTSELEVRYFRVFFYELPEFLFNWLKSYSFPEIIDQLAYYKAYVNLSNDPKSRFKDVHPLLLDSVKEKYENFKKINLDEVENLDYYIDEVEKCPIAEDQKNDLIKYFVSFKQKYNTLPLSALLWDRGQHKRFAKWDQFIDIYDFKIKLYGSFKRYYSLTESRLHISRSVDDEYTDKHLEKWKYFYRNDYDILDNIFTDVKVVSKSARKTYYTWSCFYCGRYTEFEDVKQGRLEKDEELLCMKCYEKEYFND